MLLQNKVLGINILNKVSTQTGRVLIIQKNRL